MLITCFTPFWCKNSLNSVLNKLGPLSDAKTSGSPNEQTALSASAQLHLIVMVKYIGNTSNHLELASITTKRDAPSKGLHNPYVAETIVGMAIPMVARGA